MVESLGIIFICGLVVAGICEKVKIPKMIGLLAVGIIAGEHVLGLFDEKILGISGELRQIALIIILLKAGLTLNIADLKKVGRSALMMSFVPASFEIAAHTFLAHYFLGMKFVDAALLGAVLSAVSPAVVVPRMVNYIENGWGTKKSIPQMILAGASLDDIFVIVLFSTFLAMASGNDASFASLLNIPVSIVLGILLGVIAGLSLAKFFEYRFSHSGPVKNSVKIVILLGISFLIICLQNRMDSVVKISGFLAVTSMACVIKLLMSSEVTSDLGSKTGKLWIAAELILFVLVGAAVDVSSLSDGRLIVNALKVIFCALGVRSAGVLLCLAGTDLNLKERLFCIAAYLPKATVQAAIGSVPLACGLECGNVILTVAVLSIIVTAPLGAFGMDLLYKYCLTKDER